MTRSSDGKDVLEQNVSTLLESGGEPPRISDAARTRIREALVAEHATTPAKAAARPVRTRVPLLAVGFGLAATAAAALVVTHLVGGDTSHESRDASTKLADGTTYITNIGGKVTVVGHRHVRVEGEALLDVAPGKGTFVVETGAGRIEVLGTRFLVDAQASKTTAAVVRGSVKLATDQGSVVIHAGEQAVAERGRAPVRGPAPRLSHLVSWAQQARKRAENPGVTPLRNGSLFAREPNVLPSGEFRDEYPLPLAQLTVDVVVEDRVARVALDQTFHNPHDRVLEGVYKFAIPPDASLQRLAMYVDGNLTESAVVERMRARRIYEELVYRRVDPALLEYAGAGRMNLRIYPIPAQQDKRVMVAYTQSIPQLYSDWTLEVPLPEVDQAVGDFVVSARIANCANCELSAPGQQVAVERTGNDAIVKLHKTSATIGDSFVVHVREGAAATRVAQHEDGKDRYLMVRAPAELGNAPREHRARTWVILDDVSASRSTYELAAQADLVDAFLRELDEDDKVSVIAFDVQARQLLAPTRVDDVDRHAIRQRLRDEGGVGATDFTTALEAATKALAGVAPDDAMIVYLGDGVITSGARNLDALRAQLAGKAHFVGVGIGDGPDTQTLDALAAATGGFSTTIDLADDIRWRAFDLVAALHTTRVTGVSARLVDAAGVLVPATAYLRSAQLADGEELELVAKLASDVSPAALELTGTRDGKPWTQRIALAPTAGGRAGYLPRLWAQRHISARLLAKHEPVVVPVCTTLVVTRTQAAPPPPCPTEAELRAARDEEIRKEVVTLGKQYFLLSRHTSLIVLENDAMYAKYGVRKGGGDTWAPYALPATIEVKTGPNVATPADVADDAELVRAPLQVFYEQPNYGDIDQLGGELGGSVVATAGAGTIGIGSFGTIGHGSGRGAGFGVLDLQTEQNERRSEHTRANLGLASRSQADRWAADEDSPGDAGDFVMRKERISSKTAEPAFADEKRVMGKRGIVSTRELAHASIRSIDLGRSRMTRRGPARSSWGVGPLVPARFTYPNDTAFDDLTALIPALVPDRADGWRVQLLADAPATGRFTIDPAAKQLLATARAKLPVGIYRWGDVELAVDSARRIGWHRTTEAGLAETASYDGAAWTRRYAELGLSASRPVREDDVALALAYLPIWIAEPEHYARWFAVSSRGPREVALSRKHGGKDELAFVLAFDAAGHLVSISDATGEALLSVTWSATGPTGARVLGGNVTIGFTPTAIADATQWAHGATQAGVIVELPTRLPAYWKAAVGKAEAGTPAWRHAQRQLLVSSAAVQDRTQLARSYNELRGSGGVELGDLVLASGGIATATTDAELSAALAPLATTPVARYLVAGRAYGKSQTPARMRPEIRDGMLGALWTLRSAVAQAQASKQTAAIDELMSLGDRAFMLRLAGAAIIAQRYGVASKDLVRLWNSVAIGDYKNVAHAQAAQTLYNHGRYDDAAEQVRAMIDDLDLTAPPAQLQIASYVFGYSRRGQAGGTLALMKWRDKVLAGESFEHVMALVPYAAQQAGDTALLLTRARALAGDSTDRKLAVARMAQSFGPKQVATEIIEDLVRGPSPTREVLQQAAALARAKSDLPTTLTYLERAQAAGGDEEVDLSTVRAELRDIISTAHQIAMQSPQHRADAVRRAMIWGARWRAIDPGNADIDQMLGNLLLATGDVAGGWRQLSSAIERDPWSGSGYAKVATALEQQGKVEDALAIWQQAIIIDQTNPTHRMRKARALYALDRDAEGDAVLEQITKGTWHEMWNGTVYDAKNLLDRTNMNK
jgi:hypothetical protein